MFQCMQAGLPSFCGIKQHLRIARGPPTVTSHSNGNTLNPLLMADIGPPSGDPAVGGRPLSKALGRCFKANGLVPTGS